MHNEAHFGFIGFFSRFFGYGIFATTTSHHKTGKHHLRWMCVWVCSCRCVHCPVLTRHVLFCVCFCIVFFSPFVLYYLWLSFQVETAEDLLQTNRPCCSMKLLSWWHSNWICSKVIDILTLTNAMRSPKFIGKLIVSPRMCSVPCLFIAVVGYDFSFIHSVLLFFHLQPFYLHNNSEVFEFTGRTQKNGRKILDKSCERKNVVKHKWMVLHIHCACACMHLIQFLIARSSPRLTWVPEQKKGRKKTPRKKEISRATNEYAKPKKVCFGFAQNIWINNYHWIRRRLKFSSWAPGPWVWNLSA